VDVPPEFLPPPEAPAPEIQAQSQGPTTASDDTTAPPPTGAADPITFEQIRERAYELWERNHRPEGFEIEFWLLAERELRKERERRKAADGPDPAKSAPPA
jgi:hypothetical protein